METSAAEDTERPPSALRWAQIMTGIWAVIITFLVSRTDPCATDTEWWAIFERYVSCRQANEMGDFLAGTFAPLAFLWFVAAVFIQAKELREQRRELALTRREFKQNREVAQAQAEEARNQAEALRSQAAILDQQAREQREALHDERLSVELSRLREWGALMLSDPMQFRNRDGTVGGIFAGTPHDDDVALAAVCIRLRDAAKLLKKLRAIDPSVTISFDRVLAVELTARLNRIERIGENASPQRREYLSDVQLKEASAALQFIAARG